MLAHSDVAEQPRVLTSVTLTEQVSFMVNVNHNSLVIIVDQ